MVETESSWSNYLFGPLKHQYFCNLFLVMSIFGFVFILASFMILLHGLYNQLGTVFCTRALISMFMYFVFYLQNRLMYSICQSVI